MSGLTKPKMLSDKLTAWQIVAALLAQVPADVELANIEVMIFADGEGVPGLDVTVDGFRFPIRFQPATADDPAGKVMLAYDQQVYKSMVED